MGDLDNIEAENLGSLYRPQGMPGRGFFNDFILPYNFYSIYYINRRSSSLG